MPDDLTKKKNSPSPKKKCNTRKTQKTHHIFNVCNSACRCGLAIEVMRRKSQGPLQSPIQNVKKVNFWRSFVGLLDFFIWNVAGVF
jgi:hypothetical protein